MKDCLIVRLLVSSRHFLLEMPRVWTEYVSVRRNRFGCILISATSITTACASMPGPAAALMERCPAIGAVRDACAVDARALYNDASRHAGSDRYALTAVSRWVWAKQCNGGHADSCLSLATTRRADDFPPSGADEDAIRVHAETTGLIKMWRQAGGRRLVLTNVGEQLRQGQPVDVFRTVDGKALVFWRTPQDQWAWVPERLLGSKADLEAIWKTRNKLASLSRRIERAAPGMLVFDDALRELAEIEPVLPEHVEEKTALRDKLFAMKREADTGRVGDDVGESSAFQPGAAGAVGGDRPQGPDVTQTNEHSMFAFEGGWWVVARTHPTTVARMVDGGYGKTAEAVAARLAADGCLAVDDAPTDVKTFRLAAAVADGELVVLTGNRKWARALCRARTPRRRRSLYRGRSTTVATSDLPVTLAFDEPAEVKPKAVVAKIAAMSVSPNRSNEGVWIQDGAALMQVPTSDPMTGRAGPNRIVLARGVAVQISRRGNRLAIQFGQVRTEPGGGSGLLFKPGRDLCYAECGQRFCAELTAMRSGRPCASLFYEVDQVGAFGKMHGPISVDDVAEVINIKPFGQDRLRFVPVSAVEAALSSWRPTSR